MGWYDGELEFFEGEDGIHLAHPYDEGTLCGVYHGGDDLKDTEKRTVTCAQCIRFIDFVRRVRCSKTPHVKEEQVL